MTHKQLRFAVSDCYQLMSHGASAHCAVIQCTRCDGQQLLKQRCTVARVSNTRPSGVEKLARGLGTFGAAQILCFTGTFIYESLFVQFKYVQKTITVL